MTIHPLALTAAFITGLVIGYIYRSDNCCRNCGSWLNYDYHGYDQLYGHCIGCGSCNNPNCSSKGER